jgi:hypothetical protein
VPAGPTAVADHARNGEKRWSRLGGSIAHAFNVGCRDIVAVLCDFVQARHGN